MGGGGDDKRYAHLLDDDRDVHHGQSAAGDNIMMIRMLMAVQRFTIEPNLALFVQL